MVSHVPSMYHGEPWTYHGDLWKPHGVPWCTGSHAWCAMENPWCPMESPWCSMENPRDTMEYFCKGCSTRYPSLLDRQRQYSMKRLPNTSTYDQQFERKSRPFYICISIESNALSTRPHTTISLYSSN